jgi:hypothetical protein
MIKIATCEICPITRLPFKELLEAKDAKEREQTSTRTFFRKNNGCVQKPDPT